MKTITIAAVVAAFVASSATAAYAGRRESFPGVSATACFQAAGWQTSGTNRHGQAWTDGAHIWWWRLRERNLRGGWGPPSGYRVSAWWTISSQRLTMMACTNTR